MDRYGEKKRKMGIAGFTLVETMVTLTILAIMMAITAGGLVGYLRYANFKKNNEYAQTIFTSAQSSFTYAKTSGELDDLADRLATTAYKSNELKSGMIKNGANLDGRDAMYTMTFAKGFKESDAYKGAYKTVYDMIATYVYDQDIMDNTFTVEFDPVDGKILGVCYDDKASDFNYTEGSNDNRNYSIVDRARSARYEYLIGYYGIDTLSARAPISGERPVINEQALVNSDTLHLQWKLSSKYASYTDVLTYQIKLYKKAEKDGEDDVLAASFEVNGNTSKVVAETGSTSAQQIISTDVTLYDDNGNVTGTQPMQFKAYKTSKQMMYLVLDGADQEDLNVTDGNYKDTYSIKRLGIKDHNIYAKVQGTATMFKSTAWKQTKTENAMFASKKVTKDTSGAVTGETDGIANARHLFNIRFTEADANKTNTNIAYEQTTDFAWSGDDSLISKGNLFNKQSQVAADDTRGLTIFPTITELKQNHSYTGNGGTSHKISGLNLGGKGLSLVGLFGTNNGSISHVTLANAKVQGQDYVGALCGVNGGNLSNVTVDTASSVDGANYVGGIAGSDITGKPLADSSILVGSMRTYNNLSNGADVIGESFVGGIVGYVYGYYQPSAQTRAGTLTLSIQNCKNTGFVRGTKKDGQCIGGIVGFNKLTTIQTCTSTPALPDGIKANEKANYLKSVLNGDYVGGIVGFNEGAEISECNTESDSTDLYVVGRNYVGGIVGFQTGTMDATTGNGSSEVTLDGKGQVNQANVVGEKYVGGILGLNAKTTVTKTKNTDGSINGLQVTGSIDESTNCKIINWTNKAVVMATAEYAGGITGYNSGNIEDCTTNVDTNAVSGATRRTFAYEVGADGNYIGGIAGYNKKNITAKDNTDVNSVVAGNRYVGGVVGYEGTGGSIETKIQLKGGYVEGNYFAGGFIGLNRSSELYNKTFTSKPSNVEGELYVGGVCGGNILSSGGTLKVQASNSLGEISGRAFVGGCIGYNKMVGSGYDVSTDLNQLCVSLKDTNQQIENTIEDATSTASGTMVIGDSSGNETLTCHLGRVKAEVYAGGILGYNAGNTTLKIYNVINQTRVETTANKAISGDHNATYSYGGGIIGLVSKNMTIDSCRNGSSGKVTTYGTYHGGLAEQNLGIITKCEANTFGSSTTDNVGGIVGVNDNTVDQCSTIGTISGRDKVGGIASANHGVIDGAVIENNVNGSGSGVGGVVGENFKTIKASKVNKSIIAKGSNVGGVAGINRGSLDNSNTVKSGITIQGTHSVGGFIGENIGSNIADLTNKATVDADYDAGGIVGTLTGTSTISGCTNEGTVTANKARSGSDVSYAGGITSKAESGVTISDCVNSGSVVSAAGAAGGMVGDNGKGAKITSPTINSGRVTGKSAVGGVAATNAGTISNATVLNGVTLSKVSSGNNISMGGVVGDNQNGGKITNASVGTSDGSFALKATSDGGSYGAVAGKNEGTVSGGTSNLNAKTVYATVSSGSNVTKTSANMGGIVGYNTNSVTYYKFHGQVIGKGNSNYGYGGIVGVNTKVKGAKETGVVEFCGLVGDSTLIQCVGDAMDIANIGGLVGLNEENGELKNSYVNGGSTAASAATVQSTGVGYVGGYCGYNQGTVTNMTGSSADGYVNVKTAKGHIGGMVGNNEGSLTNSSTGGGTATGDKTGSNHTWTVLASEHLTDNGTGGAIGFNSSGKNMTNLTNYADVSKGAASSGANACGGMVGRMQNQTNSTWRMTNCNNYGTIIGRESTGGMIGRWKYKGGTIEKCNNYGNITGYNYDIGGVVGDMYQVTDKETFTISGCKNTGNITAYSSSTTQKNPTGSKAGGIFGGTGSSTVSSLNVTVTDCINTGNIVGGSQLGGITGNYAIGNSTMNITKCRNYGTYTSTASSSGGIVSGGNVSVKSCFGVATQTNPIRPSGSFTETYFFKAPTTEDEVSSDTVVSVAWTNGKDGSASSKEGESNIASIADGNLSTRYTRNDVTNGKGDVEITFKRPITVDTFTTYWYANDAETRRIYDYNIYYKDVATNAWVKLGEQRQGYGSRSGENAIEKDVWKDNAIFGGVTTAKIKIEVLKNSGGNPAISIWEWKVNGETMKLGDLQAADSSSLEVTKNTTGSDYSALNAGEGIYIDDLPKNPLDITTAMSDDERVTYANAIDPKLKLNYDNRYGIGKLDAPTGLQLTNENGNYTATWTADARAYYYRLKIDVYDDAGKSGTPETRYIDVTSGNSASIPSEDLGGKYIEVSVQAMNGDDTDNDKSDTKDSDFSTVQGASVKLFLPEPIVHYVLYKKDDGSAGYKLVLENADKYNGLDVDIHVLRDTTAEKVFKASAGGGDTTYTGTTGSPQYTAYAVAANDATKAQYNDSSRYAKESCVLTPATFASTNSPFTCTFNGFTGTTPDTLSYSLAIKSNSKEMYCRSEFLAEDDVLGVPVVIASSKVRASTTGTSSVSLDGLKIDPTDTDKVFEVRSYPISSQNDVALYTTKEASIDTQGKTEEQIKSAMAKYLDGSNIKAGYSIEKTSSGYDIYYSLFFEKYDTYKKSIWWRSSDSTLEMPKSSQPKPELPTTISQDGDAYTFEWDKEKTGTGYTNATYEVVITGTTMQNEEVELWSSAETTEKSHELDGSEWQYKEIKLKVTRIGEQDSKGILSKFGTSNEQTYKQKIHFPKMEAPTITLQDAKELNYDMDWNVINKDTYENDFDHYEIIVTDKTDASKSFTNKEIRDITKHSVSLNLDPVAGDDITITIRAVAKDGDDRTYQSGNPSDGYDMAVPSRMTTPVVTSEFLTLTPNMSTGVLSQSQFEDTGMTLQMIAPGAKNGGYVVISGLYKDSGKDLNKDTPDLSIGNGEAQGMSGNLASSKYGFKGISYDYAGYYLRVKLRSGNEGEISSLWSSQVEFQLPKVRINTPKASETTVSQEDTVENTSDPDSIPTTKSVLHDGLKWSVPQTDEGKLKDYIIDTTSASKDVDDKDVYHTKASIDDTITLSKTDCEKEANIPFLVYDTSADTFTEKDVIKPMEKNADDIYATSSVGTGDNKITTETYTYTYRLGYVRDITWKNSNNQQLKVTSESYLIATATVVSQPGKKTSTTYDYELVLPDVTDSEAITQLDDAAHRLTNMVRIQGEVKEPERYVNTYIEQWERTEEKDIDAGTIYGTKITEEEN